MSTNVHSSKGSAAPEAGAGDVGGASLPSPSVAAPASSGVSLAPSAPGSVPGTVKKKKKSKKGTRKSKAPGANGALDLTPSTAVPAVGVGVARSGAKAAAANDEDADDISVPPAEDLDHDFFRASEAPPPVSRRSYDSHEPAHEVETRDPRIEQLMTAEVKRRRAHFAKYVKAAVAISLVLCLAAVIRVGIRRNHSDDSTSAMAATQIRPTPVVVVPEPPTVQKPIDPPPPPAATDTAAAAEPTMTAEPVAAPAASNEVAKTPEPTPPASATVVASAAPEPPSAASAVASADPAAFDPKEAAKEKRKSQQLLDQGKIKDAIEHGEVSVKLDPTDAEAWLILGAAYQMKGDTKEAKRCFGSCIKEGKRGPKGECMAMPH